MTREEAILYIKELQKTYASMDKKVAEAIEMATEALSADVVSRDVYDKRTQADEEIIDSYRKEFQKAISADRPITSGYIADDKEVPPYTTTSAVSADRPTDWTPLRFEDEYKMTSDFPWELDGSWVIVTDGQRVSVERIKKDAYDHFFPNGRYFELEDTIAWMPLPKIINNITESPNDVDETDDEVIEPSDIISRADAKKEVYLLGKNPSINEIWDCLDALPSADAEQVTSKLKNPCDSLLTGDSDGSKEQKSKLEPSDLISRADVLKHIDRHRKYHTKWQDFEGLIRDDYAENFIKKAPSVSAESYKDGYDDGIREERPKAYKIGYNDGYERGKAECVSAERVGEWNTGKPTKRGKYIVTLIGIVDYRFVEIMHYDKPCMPNREVSGECWYRSDDEWGDVVYDDTDILAWQPLPKPYKGGDDE